MIKTSAYLLLLAVFGLIFGVPEKILAAVQSESTVTTVVGSPKNGSGGTGKIAPDGKHACPVIANYIAFPKGSYSAIGNGEYSYVCAHCRPIMNAIDIGVFPEGGTEVAAVTAGELSDVSNPRGGTALWLVGDDGSNYYYAHLRPDTLAIKGKGTKRVEAGEVIGNIAAATGKEAAEAKNNGVAHVHFSAGPPGNEHTFEDPARTPAGPLLDSWCGNDTCKGRTNFDASCGG